MIAGRHIVLGVTGGVAAYKAAYLARRLMEHGAEVRTIMTPAATQFIGEATLAAITGVEPAIEFFGGPDVSPHTTLARWADAIVIAPATASTIAKIANGETSGLLAATVLASTASVVIAPAMHTAMWEHPATQANVARLKTFEYHIVEPQVGALAGGDEGIGRLAQPEAIVAAVSDIFSAGDLSGMTVLITAGGTRESIDPVRFIGNRSSGKMGNALATSAAGRGAKVILVTTVQPPQGDRNIDIVDVESADEMAEAVWSRAADCDVAVLAAAVADFRPDSRSETKLRRADGPPTIKLAPTPDILKGVDRLHPRPFLVGFAAEVGSLAGAVEKAANKNVDLLVANDVAQPGSGFGTDTNEVTLVTSDGTTFGLPLMAKHDVADAIWDAVLEERARN